MSHKRDVGRPSKITWTVIIKLADSLQHNATITEACRYAKISRQTYYNHINDDEVFAIKMQAATNNQNKLVMNFLTTY